MKRLTVPTTATQCAEVREIIKVRDRRHKREEGVRKSERGGRRESVRKPCKKHLLDQFSFAATNAVCGTVSAKNLFTLRCNCICFVVAYSQKT